MDHGIIGRRIHVRLWVPQVDEDAAARAPSGYQQEESLPAVQGDERPAATAEAEDQASEAAGKQPASHGLQSAMGNRHQVWLGRRRRAILLLNEHHRCVRPGDCRLPSRPVL